MNGAFATNAAHQRQARISELSLSASGCCSVTDMDSRLSETEVVRH